MLLAGGLLTLISLSACTPKVMYSTDNIIETLLRRTGEKRSFVRIGESRTGYGYTVTLSDVTLSYDNTSPKAVLQIYSRAGDEEALIQTAFGSGETKQIFFSDNEILEISVSSIHSDPTRSECGASFSFRQLEPDKTAPLGR